MPASYSIAFRFISWIRDKSLLCEEEGKAKIGGGSYGEDRYHARFSGPALSMLRNTAISLLLT